jgi:hypothetical protein
MKKLRVKTQLWLVGRLDAGSFQKFVSDYSHFISKMPSKSLVGIKNGNAGVRVEEEGECMKQ